ncbi:hypothetical protein ACU8KH_05958 [Lachancea thermotolerans]
MYGTFQDGRVTVQALAQATCALAARGGGGGNQLPHDCTIGPSEHGQCAQETFENWRANWRAVPRDTHGICRRASGSAQCRGGRVVRPAREHSNTLMYSARRGRVFGGESADISRQVCMGVGRVYICIYI